MAKKCIVCEKEAEFSVKGNSDFYCKECAEEHFGDLEMLQKIDEETISLKKYLNDKANFEDNK